MFRKCKSGIRAFQIAARPRPTPSTEFSPTSPGRPALQHPDSPLGRAELPVGLRLPGYDLQTRRLELGAFCLFGLTAAALITLAGVNALRFSENREGIAAALSSRGILISATSGPGTNRVFTNLTAIPAQSRGRSSGITHPASNPS
jgi:hypothetical protein